ncbi:hypothetical protein POM88_000846 [Heracleum sosnowskyi]|uniref:Uncharacterized protein n=1 Tax=Heracleum sosnowskyi TaxID=360622 RepID=A0AAD8JCL5_9APIA|nr:hypothetical protein POM88_000846 [Heracleum sosnowskyi]
MDVQNILKTLGTGHRGRVKLTRKYHQALEASISKNYPGNGIISCMSHNTDGLYRLRSLEHRAVGGCGIYVSDKPGHHNFNLLKKLVLPNGSILRAKLPGRPTRDCLFSDPTRDKYDSLLKIWNLNDYNGVVGVFNCQGAGCYLKILSICIELLTRIGVGMPLYFHIVVETLSSKKFICASIGLINMFNSGGAIKELKDQHESEKDECVRLKVHGCGMFGSYASIRPKRIRADANDVEFKYEERSGFITFTLTEPVEGSYHWDIIAIF